METILKLPRKAIIFVSLLMFGVLLYQVLPVERVLKMTKEIERISVKPDNPKRCVQYALKARKSGFYPCFNGESPKIYLNAGEIRKYGKTCIGKDRRYRNLKALGLDFVSQFTGTEKQCLIVEKQKIYNYALLPENLKRAKETGTKPLIRPPGNKIDR